MGKIYVIGLGPGDPDLLTLGAIKRIKSGDKNFLRTKDHPTVDYFHKEAIAYESFDGIYNEGESFEDVYQSIVSVLRKESKDKDINYFVPGNPMVAERTVEILFEEGLDIEIVSGLSFIEPMLELVKIDPVGGLKFVDGAVFHMNMIDINLDIIITQVYNHRIISNIKLVLSEVYGDDYQVYLVQGAGVKSKEKLIKLPIYQLDRIEEINLLTSLFIPKVDENPKKVFDFKDILGIMEILRSSEGCPWDRDQTHKSLRPYLIEEAYELVDAIDSQDPDKIAEELGDILLQIAFHSQIASENGDFNIYHITSGLGEKLYYRHPHVFSKEKLENSQEVVYNWNDLKNKERKIKSLSEELRSVVGLPGLIKSYKIQEKASRIGFDWEDISGAFHKTQEELDELLVEIHKKSDKDLIESELGDVLFSVVNIARFLKLDPEVALNRAINKFINRFTFMEEEAKSRGLDFKNLSQDLLEDLWEEAKENGIY